jgi:hypothetical protein
MTNCCNWPRAASCNGHAPLHPRLAAAGSTHPFRTLNQAPTSTAATDIHPFESVGESSASAASRNALQILMIVRRLLGALLMRLHCGTDHHHLVEQVERELRAEGKSECGDEPAQNGAEPSNRKRSSQALKSWLRSSKKVEEQACGMWTGRGTNGLRRSFGGPMRAVMLGALSAAKGRLEQFKAGFAPSGERACGWPFLRGLEQRFVFIRGC